MSNFIKTAEETEHKTELDKDYLFFSKLLEQDAKPYYSTVKGDSIEEKIEDQEERKKKIENDGLQQDINLKKITLLILFGFLAIETIAVFAIAFLQGFKFHDFNIEEWSFRIIIISTILQITAMLTIAVQHLFPKRN